MVHWLVISVTATFVTVCFYIIKKIYFRPSFYDVGYAPDTVILHQLGKGAYCPSMSPFIVKLETFLRLAKIPYVNVYDRRMGPKSKVPWITFNGQPVCDSQLIIEFLKKKLGVDLNKSVSDAEATMAHMIRRLTEDSLYWYLVVERWVFQTNRDWFIDAQLPKFLCWYISRNASQQTNQQGVGRHSREDVYSMMEADMTALSQLLGNKAYFLGAEPTEVDCTVFGALSQLKYNMYGSAADILMTEHLSNLAAYCDRMRDNVWPDWDECILCGKKQKMK